MKGLEAWSEDSRRPMVLGPEELVQALRERHQGRSWRYSRKAAVKLVQDQYDLRRHAPRPETREEDIAEVRERIEGVIDDLANMHEGDECKAKGGAGCLACIAQDSLSEALDALSRLAAPKPAGQEDAYLEALTPNEETKVAYIGEFKLRVRAYDEDGKDISWDEIIPWTTIKEIMAAIKARAALREPADAVKEFKE